MGRYYGIDLGTTNTVVACCTEQQTGNPRLELVKIRQREFYNKRSRSFELLPSIVYLDSDNNMQIGFEAKGFKDAGNDSKRYIFNTKLRMGYNDEIMLGDKKYSPKDIASLILDKCRQEMVFDSKGSFDDRIVITVPATFGKDERDATMVAARQAKFNDVTIFDEPSAALLAYVYENAQDSEDVREIDLFEEKKILTIDLGGGTCDICYISAKQEDINFVLKDLKPCKRINLGGFNFDKAIAEYIINKKIKKQLHIDGDIDESDLHSIIVFSETAKEEISAKVEEEIASRLYNFSDYETGKYSDNEFDNYNHEGIIKIYGREITIKISKSDIDLAINALIESQSNHSATKNDSNRTINIEDCIRGIVDIEKDRIDYVLFTGGMSKYLTLRKKIFNLINRPIITPKDPMLAVAKGAALYNIYKVSKETAAFNLDRQNITTEALLLDKKEGLPAVLVSKGEPIKNGYSRITETFYTTSPKGLKIGLFEGDDEYDCNLKKLNYVDIIFEPTKTSGTMFTIEYSIDENRMYEFKIVFADGDIYHITKNSELVKYKQ